MKTNYEFYCLAVADMSIVDNILIGLKVNVFTSNFYCFHVKARGKTNPKINKPPIIVREISFTDGGDIVLNGSGIFPAFINLVGLIVR